MCFSAVASFAGGAVISGVGIATQQERKKPGQRLFASIPLVFALQQFSEGVIWVTLKSNTHASLQNVATHVFLAAALVVWPIVVPLSVFLMEVFKGRKMLLIALIILGGIVSIYNVHNLLTYQVSPQIQDFHIKYIDNFPTSLGFIPIFYGISTLVPLFVSSVRRVWLLGLAIAISLAVSIIFYTDYVTSVWCFFAAILSVMIYWILRSNASNPKSHLAT